MLKTMIKFDNIRKTSRLMQSILLSLVLIVLTFLIAPKFSLQIVSESFTNFSTITYYHDFDNDGRSEKVLYTGYTDDHTGISVFKENFLIDEWALRGNYALLLENVFHDINNDGFSELFVFTYFEDSLHLNCLDPINEQFIVENRAIDLVPVKNGELHSSVRIIGSYDTDNDGVKEIYFSILTGYGLTPRSLYSYNIATDKLIKSIESAAGIVEIRMHDIDNDQIPEILASGIALGNTDASEPYSDQLCWLLVYKVDLTFKFEPVKLGEYPSRCITRYVKGFDGVEEGGLLVAFGSQAEEPDYLALFNTEGDLIKKRYCEFLEFEDYITLFEQQVYTSDPYLLKNNGDLFKVTKDLLLVKIKSIAKNFGYCYLRDFSSDGLPEIITFERNRNEIRIIKDNFNTSVRLKLPRQLHRIIYSDIEGDEYGANFAIDGGDYLYHFNYGKSLIYRNWYYVISIELLFSILLILFIRNFLSVRKLRIINSKSKLAELQLRAIQNQIDPHFTFNLLSAFKNLIDENDKKKAEYVFENYSDLLKRTVLNGDKLQVSLEEELDFTKSYIELEAFRYGGKFSYSLLIKDDVDTSMEIPKMLVHIFVENAIKHGLRHKQGNGGELILKVMSINSTVEILITDNGIGREKAAEIRSFSTGRGMEIVKDMIAIYKSVYHRSVEVNVTDLVENDCPSGTEVKISIQKST